MNVSRQSPGLSSAARFTDADWCNGHCLPRRSTAKPSAWDSRHRGFTLVELLVVMSILVILTAMTIGAINLSITSERVRGSARQIQSKIEGARDRAIFNSRRDATNPRPVGIRLLVDENITEYDPPRSTVCTSIVYIESPGNETSPLDTNDIDNDGDRLEYAVFCQLVATTSGTAVIGAGLDPDGAGPELPTPPSWSTLYDRGLIGPGTRIRILGSTDESDYTLHPSSFPVRTESAYSAILGGADPNGNNVQDPVLFLVRPHPDAPSSNPLGFSIALNPDVMAGEEPLVLPRGACIDLETSHLPDGWVTRTASGPQFSNRMDILFSARGTVVGDAAAAGIIHLHIVEIADAMANALPGSPTLSTDSNGDGQLDLRHGDELGITIFTKSGRVISHPVKFDSIAYPARWQASTSYSSGAVVSPTIYNGLVFRAIRFNSGSAGTSGTSEPAWNMASGGQTHDGQIFWQSVKHDVWDLALDGEVAK